MGGARDPAAQTPRSYEFRRQREQAWAHLEDLVRQAEDRGTGSLDADDLEALPVLFRRTASSLSVARTLSLDKNVLAYLESLVARAYLVVYSTKRGLLASISILFGRRIPPPVPGMGWAVALAAGLVIAGTLCGLFMTIEDPDMFFSFVGAEMAGGRSPLSTADELRAVLYAPDTHRTEDLSVFASFLFSHNARIGMFCFALGILGGIPVLLLLFTNGLSLGAFWGIHLQKGIAVDFWLWILPHGVTELLALCICGAAGLHVGRAVVFPGRHTRVENLALHGRRAAGVAAGCVVLFFVAALIEGFFRQIVSDPMIRLMVGASTAALWGVYFLRTPGDRRRRGTG